MKLKERIASLYANNPRLFVTVIIIVILFVICKIASWGNKPYEMEISRPLYIEDILRTEETTEPNASYDESKENYGPASDYLQHLR